MLAVAGQASARALPTWTILAYLEARGGLTDAAQHYQNALEQTARRRGYSVATLTLPDYAERTFARRCLMGERSRPARDRMPLPGGAVSGVLGTFVASAIEKLPAQHYALLVMGHGSGLLRAPGGAGLTPQALRQELEPAVARLGRPLDLLGLDTCFGGSVEVAYEFRGTCHYLTAAPGVIYSPGLAWSEAFEASDCAPVAVMRAVVGAGMSADGPAALVGLDLERLPGLSLALGALSAAVRKHLAELLPAMTFVRSRTRSWGERSELCDLRELAAGLQCNTADAEVTQASGQVKAAVDGLVVARWEGNVEGGDGAGLGIYYPPTIEEVPAGYAKQFELAEVTGWGAYLREAWGRVSGTLIGGASSSTE